MYILHLVDRPSAEAVAAALAQAFGVPPAEVDVAAEGELDRNWGALVTCTTEERFGDVALSLDVYALDAVADQPAEHHLAAALAALLRTAVLFPAEGVRPSAYWVATPEGVVARARVADTDDPDEFLVDAVEAPVARLPHVRVIRIPEAVYDLRVATPVADAFRDGLVGEREEPAVDSLGAWEMLVRTMADAWRPAGWYPSKLYGWRLEARDRLSVAEAELPPQDATALRAALAGLDELFLAHTVEDPEHRLAREITGGDDPAGRGWWWYRRPDPLPWDEGFRPCHQPGQRPGPVGTADGDGGVTDGARPQENIGQITP
ncbi:hypothetical protein [Actinacidiphila glaucinigra]|uniref:Uncharacterized protein n=1 Tax=Actinacidiphila glaucinigra TaxID=235986 RepID=A0A239LJ07_9ACTN|nr:hypothetical protein [Actinacidiphila glaucinigra]SNT30451.1 hypothetical protein SAMN05216252_12039 [Actinacidiphila glaucinigra]